MRGISFSCPHSATFPVAGFRKKNRDGSQAKRTRQPATSHLPATWRSPGIHLPAICQPRASLLPATRQPPASHMPVTCPSPTTHLLASRQPPVSRGCSARQQFLAKAFLLFAKQSWGGSNTLGSRYHAENENVNLKRSDLDRSGRFRFWAFFCPEQDLGAPKFSGRFRSFPVEVFRDFFCLIRSKFWDFGYDFSSIWPTFETPWKKIN